MKIKLCFAFVLLSGIFSTAFSQTVYYVSPNGSGSAFSKTAPGTLAGVKERLQQLKKDNAGTATVYLKGGTYQLAETYRLTPAEAGTEKFKVIFTAAPGEKPFLTGGKRITGWKPFTDGIYQATVPAGWAFRQLYVNGKMATRARTPNRTNDLDMGLYYRVMEFRQADKKIIVHPREVMPPLKNLRQVEIVTHQHWYQSHLRIDSMEKGEGTIVITPQKPDGTNMFQVTYSRMLDPGKPYMLENALEFLDYDAEWYHDRQANIVYYKPRPGEDINKIEIIAPTIDILLHVEGTDKSPALNLEFSNLRFGYSNWLEPDKNGLTATQGVQARNYPGETSGQGAVRLDFAGYNTFNNCEIFAAGSNGLVMGKGIFNSKFVNGHIHEISANAIVIDTYKKPNPPQELKCRDNVIANNLITNLGLVYTNGMGLLASCVSGLIVEHNEISYGRYTGMQIGNHFGDKDNGTGNNLIRYNNVHHVMLHHDDGGAIYTLSRQRGTKIHNNWIHDYTKSPYADAYPTNGVFLDNGTTYVEVTDNVFTNVPNVDKIKENQGAGVKNNTFRNNESQDPAIIKEAGINKKMADQYK